SRTVLEFCRSAAAPALDKLVATHVCLSKRRASALPMVALPIGSPRQRYMTLRLRLLLATRSLKFHKIIMLVLLDSYSTLLSSPLRFPTLLLRSLLYCSLI